MTNTSTYLIHEGISEIKLSKLKDKSYYSVHDRSVG